ncbi:hypothetical protein SBY92_002680 [Candida maltosa Xu316]|uniref:Uncharacterized protein n=1 Tax=Candida maltosa (strain Xu316) TaxID=1245528 RepID=M3JUG9_CANMX|nr:hypothetical protein G210_3229 [Candida maltosa Xu316]
MSTVSSSTSTSLPSELLLDPTVSTTATITPSLTDLHLATDVRNNENGAQLASDSVQVITTSLTSGIVYASESSQLTNAIGTFSASSDVRTLTLSSSVAPSVSSSAPSANSGDVLDLKKVKYGIILSSVTVLSFVLSL